MAKTDLETVVAKLALTLNNNIDKEKNRRWKQLEQEFKSLWRLVELLDAGKVKQAYKLYITLDDDQVDVLPASIHKFFEKQDIEKVTGKVYTYGGFNG